MLAKSRSDYRFILGQALDAHDPNAYLNPSGVIKDWLVAAIMGDAAACNLFLVAAHKRHAKMLADGYGNRCQTPHDDVHAIGVWQNAILIDWIDGKPEDPEKIACLLHALSRVCQHKTFGRVSLAVSAEDYAMAGSWAELQPVYCRFYQESATKKGSMSPIQFTRRVLLWRQEGQPEAEREQIAKLSNKFLDKFVSQSNHDILGVLPWLYALRCVFPEFRDARAAVKHLDMFVNWTE